MSRPALLAALALFASAAPAQTYDQSVLAAVLEREAPLPDAPVEYAVWRVEHESGSSVYARHALYLAVGEGDVAPGRRRLALAQLLGQPGPDALLLGDTLVLPARPADFDLSPLAYAPYPRHWPGAVGIDRAVVVDKTTQTWAAHEAGRLVRWGPASTGAAEMPTPVGRFTMNWMALERESSEAPAGETWLMRYVMNIHAARGIHLHQYDVVPTGSPQGHGCVRMVTSDARWLYEWSSGGQTTRGEGALGGRVTGEGTLVIVQGTEPEGPPERFVMRPGGPSAWSSSSRRTRWPSPAGTGDPPRPCTSPAPPSTGRYALAPPTHATEGSATTRRAQVREAARRLTAASRASWWRAASRWTPSAGTGVTRSGPTGSWSAGPPRAACAVRPPLAAGRQGASWATP